jgi:mRNA degradation ribonuclease J1/J2
MIIMLNLLIAIISESFTRVTSVAQEAGYREMADLIAENTYLIPDDEKYNFCPDNRYLIIATDIQQEIGTVISFDDQMEQVV